jgi:hypothetical protein
MAQIFPENAPSADRDDLAAHMLIQKVESPDRSKNGFFHIIPKNFFKVKQAHGFDFFKKLCYNIIKKNKERGMYQ